MRIRTTPRFLTSEYSKKKITKTVTSKGEVIWQSCYERDMWREKTYSTLLKTQNKFEDRVVNSLPSKLRNYALRQFPMVIDGHIFYADIYVKNYRIAIEIDGGYHGTKEQMAKDKERDTLFARKGIRVYRISNEDVVDPHKLGQFIDVLDNVKRRGEFERFSDTELKYVSNASEFIEHLAKREVARKERKARRIRRSKNVYNSKTISNGFADGND